MPNRVMVRHSMPNESKPPSLVLPPPYIYHSSPNNNDSITNSITDGNGGGSSPSWMERSVFSVCPVLAIRAKNIA